MDGIYSAKRLVNGVPTSLRDLGYTDVGLDDAWYVYLINIISLKKCCVGKYADPMDSCDTPTMTRLARLSWTPLFSLTSRR